MTTIREYLKNRQNESMEEYQKKIAAHKKRVRLTILAVVGVIAIGAAGFKLYWDNRSFDEYEITDTRTMEDTGSSRFFRFGDGLLAYTDDGISYIAKNQVIWTQAFEMKSPLVDVCNETVAIGDLRDTVVYIYDTSGQQGKINTVYPILNLDVSEQGVVAAITEDSTTNRVEVFDKEGIAIAEGQTYVTGEGCPINLSISNDGTKLVVSYIYVEGGSAKSKVVFYNYSEVGKNEVGRIVGGFNHYDATIVSRVEFLDNDTVAAFGDNIFTIYSVRQKPEKAAEVTFEQNIKSIFYNEEYIGVALESGDYDNPYIIKTFDTDGDEKMNYNMDFFYTGIAIEENWIVLYNETDMRLITVSGRQRFEGAIDGGIKQVICTDKPNRYYIINEEYNIMTVRLR